MTEAHPRVWIFSAGLLAIAALAWPVLAPRALGQNKPPACQSGTVPVYDPG
jgi:hypothetical protein